MSVYLEGSYELAEYLGKYKDTVIEGTRKAVKLYGSMLQTKAMLYAPVDTGTLKRSISFKIEDGGLTAVITPTAHYASYVEYGTRFMNAQPYLTPAFNKVVPQFKYAMNKVMKAM